MKGKPWKNFYRKSASSSAYSRRRKYGATSGQTTVAVRAPRSTALARNPRQMKYPTTEVPRGPSLWADRMVVKLTYSEQGVTHVITALNSAGGLNYKLNTPFFPTQGTSSTQIPGLTEVANMYNRYKVIASSCLTSFTNSTGTTTDSYDCVIVPYTATTVISFATVPAVSFVKNVAGNPYAKSGTVSGYQGMNRKTLYQYITMEKLLGDNTCLTSDSWAGLTGSGGAPSATSPAGLAFWLIAGCDHDGNTASTDVFEVQVRISYWVEFYGRELETI